MRLARAHMWSICNTAVPHSIHLRISRHALPLCFLTSQNA
jgi:hypothetical protein